MQNGGLYYRLDPRGQCLYEGIQQLFTVQSNSSVQKQYGEESNQQYPVHLAQRKTSAKPT
jgi:hypothetical protein